MNVPNTIEMPKINGLTVRAFDIDKDLSAVVKLANIVSDFEESDEYLSEESLCNYYSHVVNCDFATDFMLVEVEGQLVGFQRISWREMDLENTISYRMVGNVHPDWMNKGIATFMMDWAEDAIKELERPTPAFFCEENSHITFYERMKVPYINSCLGIWVAVDTEDDDWDSSLVLKIVSVLFTEDDYL